MWWGIAEKYITMHLIALRDHFMDIVFRPAHLCTSLFHGLWRRLRPIRIPYVEPRIPRRLMSRCTGMVGIIFDASRNDTDVLLKM